MFWNKYPYTDFHELNLDMILALMKKLHDEWDVFTAVNRITNAGAWDITKQYQAWTIVSDNNIGYISLKPVPAGVAITNIEYWGVIADYDVLITDLSNRISVLENFKTDLESAITCPEFYGAKGDGVADDTAALQSAIDDGAIVVLSTSKTYRVTAPLTLHNNTYINGGNATIYGDGCLIIDNTDPYPYVDIENVTFDSTETEAISICCYFSKFINCGFGKRLHFVAGTGGGTLVENKIIGCKFYAGLIIDGDGNKLTDGFLKDCVFNVNEAAIFIGCGAGWTVDNIHAYGNIGSADAVTIYKGYNANISNIYIECTTTGNGLRLVVQQNCNLSNLNIKKSTNSLYVTKDGYFPNSNYILPIVNSNIENYYCNFAVSIVNGNVGTGAQLPIPGYLSKHDLALAGTTAVNITLPQLTLSESYTYPIPIVFAGSSYGQSSFFSGVCLANITKKSGNITLRTNILGDNLLTVNLVSTTADTVTISVAFQSSSHYGHAIVLM